MINLEEEARKRRERLRSTRDSAQNERKTEPTIEESIKDEPQALVHEEFLVPDDEVLLDSSGAEILGMDSKIPDTLEAQVKELLAPQTNKNLNVNSSQNPNSDLKREYERRKTLLDKQTKKSINEQVRARLSPNESE